MPTPNITPSSSKSTMVALVVAVSASGPSKRPTQIALIEPFSDCSTLEPSTGSENINKVRAIGPCVRSMRACGLRGAGSGWFGHENSPERTQGACEGWGLLSEMRRRV